MMAFVVLCVYLHCLIETTTEAGFTRGAREPEAAAIDPRSATQKIETNKTRSRDQWFSHLN